MTAQPAIARYIRSRVRAHHRQDGWLVFLSDRGRWWATTTTRPVEFPASFWQPQHTVMAADAIDADEYLELAGKLTGRSEQ